MILIVVKWQTRPEWTDRFMDLVKDFTEATRAEPHVNSVHFKKAMGELGKAVVARPKIISRQVDGEGWDELGEVQMDQ